MPGADGSIVVQADVDGKQAQTELGKLEKQAENLNETLKKTEGKKTLRFSTNIEEVDKKLYELGDREKKLQEQLDSLLKKGFSDASSEVVEIDSQIDEVASELAKLMAIRQQGGISPLRTGGTTVTDPEAFLSDLQKTEEETQKVSTNIEKAADKTEEITKNTKQATGEVKKMSPAADEASKHMEKFVNRVKGLARRVFVFALITRALRALKDYIWSAIQTNDEAMASVARLQGALRTLAQPILNVLIPAFTVLVNVITRVINALARLVSMIFGTTARESAKAAKSLYGQEKALKGVGNAAKKASKQLADFDEINQLSASDTSGGGGGASGGITPDFNSMVNDGLSAIIELFAGAALLALGAILTFSGANILLGIGLMALGALAIWDAVTTTPGLAGQLVKSGLASVMEIIGSMIAVIGVILIVYGHMAAGIGLVLAGIALFAVGSGAKADGDFAKNVKSRLIAAAKIIGECIAVIGVLLVVSGQLSLGIGMIVAGAAIFAVSEFAEQEGTLQEKIVRSLSETAQVIGPLIATLGVALLCMGNIPLGAALLVAGIALFTAGAVALNWDLLKKNIVSGLVNVFGAISPYIAALGLFLLFVPGMMPYGVGMLVAGIGMFTFSKIAPNWNAILDMLKETFNNILEWWKSGPSKYVSASFWSDVGKGIINGLHDGLKSAWEAVKTWVEEKVAWIKSKISSALSALGGGGKTGTTTSRTTFVGGGSRSGTVSGTVRHSAIPDLSKSVKIPALASGSVIPPNREFLAVLGDQKSGTNIEAPLETIVQAFRQVMAEQGGGGSGRPIILMLDRRELGRAVVDVGSQESTRVGLSLT